MKGVKASNLHTPVSAAGLHANQNLGHSEHLGGLLGWSEELRLEPAGELRREHAACFEQKYILLKLRSIKKFSGFSSSFYNPSFIRFLSLSLSHSPPFRKMKWNCVKMTIGAGQKISHCVTPVREIAPSDNIPQTPLIAPAPDHCTTSYYVASAACRVRPLD